MHRRKWKLAVAAALISVLVVRYYTLTHPYLLADNRHYPFYLWRRVIDRSTYSRYLLVPGYVFAAYVVADAMRGSSVFFQV